MNSLKKITYTWLLLTAVIAGTIIAAGCNQQPSATNSDQAPTKVVLQLKWVYNAGFVGDLVSQEKGFWKKRGLDVEVRPGGSAITPIKVVTAGGAQFGVATGDQMLLAAEDGNPVIAVALAYQRNPLTWIVRADSKINSPADFKGKKIALTFIDDEASFNAMMKKVGLDPKKDVQIVPVKYDTSPFLRGDVDAFPVYENTEAIEIANELKKSGIQTKLIGPADVGLVSYSNLYFTTHDYALSHPEIVKAFVQGVLEGWDYAEKHPEEAAQIVAKYDKDDTQETISESTKSTLGLAYPTPSVSVGEMTKDGWLSTQQILLGSGQLKTAQDVGQIYTNEYAQEFNRK